MLNKKLLHKLQPLKSFGLMGLLSAVLAFPVSFATAQDADTAQDLSDTIPQETPVVVPAAPVVVPVAPVVVPAAPDAAPVVAPVVVQAEEQADTGNTGVVITAPPPLPQHEGLDFEIIGRGGTAFSLYVAGVDFPDTLVTATDGFGFNAGGSARLMFNHPAYTIAGINNGAYLSTGVELYFDYTRVWLEADTGALKFDGRTDYMHLMAGLATSITVNTSPDEVTRFGSSALLGACGRDTLVLKITQSDGSQEALDKDPDDYWGPCLGVNLWLLQSLGIFVFGTELGFNTTYLGQLDDKNNSSGIFFSSQVNLLAGFSF